VEGASMMGDVDEGALDGPHITLPKSATLDTERRIFAHYFAHLAILVLRRTSPAHPRMA
jgi:hypothetical protein